MTAPGQGSEQREQGEGPVRVLAHRGGIELVCLLLAGSGAACHECGHGTRVTSKRWARCKKCDARVRRRPMNEVADAIERATATPPDSPRTERGAGEG